jgi:hypothetical protein
MFTRRSEIPDVSIRPPARMKRGMASKGKLEAPEKRFSGTTLREAVPFQNRNMAVVIASPKPMGTPRIVRKMITPRMSHSTPVRFLSLLPCRAGDEAID